MSSLVLYTCQLNTFEAIVFIHTVMNAMAKEAVILSNSSYATKIAEFYIICIQLIKNK